MGAGINKAQQRGYEYRGLLKIKAELEKAGVGVQYQRGRYLVHFENENSRGGGFNIRYSRMNASKGECCMYPVIYLSGCDGAGTYRGWWDRNDYKTGLRLLKENFGLKK